MNLSSYAVVAEPPDKNHTVTAALLPLLELIHADWSEWAVKPGRSKTIICLERYQHAIQLLFHFARQDNWKAAYLSMRRHNIDAIGLKQCFRGQLQKQQRALHLYRAGMLSVVKWLEQSKEVHEGE